MRPTATALAPPLHISYLDIPAERAVIEARIEGEREEALAEEVNDTVDRSWTRCIPAATTPPCASRTSRSSAAARPLPLGLPRRRPTLTPAASPPVHEGRPGQARGRCLHLARLASARQVLAAAETAARRELEAAIGGALWRYAEVVTGCPPGCVRADRASGRAIVRRSPPAPGPADRHPPGPRGPWRRRDRRGGRRDRARRQLPDARRRGRDGPQTASGPPGCGNRRGIFFLAADPAR